MSTTLRRALSAEAKILSAKDRTCSFIASDQTIDCYREIVRAAGWKFERFAKNAPFVDSHNYSSVGCLLGKVTGWNIAGKALAEDVQFIPEGKSPLADFAWDMASAGFLKAVSVGFMPVRVRSQWSDPVDFAAACAEMGVKPADAKGVQAIHWEQDQTELSLVLIGANPNAVARAHSAGAVSDARLASLGFGDDDVSFLHDCANGWENADAVLRRNIRAQLRGIVAPSITNNFAGNPSTVPATQRAAVAEADAHARRELLAELNRVAAAPRH